MRPVATGTAVVVGDASSVSRVGGNDAWVVVVVLVACEGCDCCSWLVVSVCSLLAEGSFLSRCPDLVVLRRSSLKSAGATFSCKRPWACLLALSADGSSALLSVKGREGDET